MTPLKYFLIYIIFIYLIFTFVLSLDAFIQRDLQMRNISDSS